MDTALLTWMDEIDRTVHNAIKEVIQSEKWDLDDYLRELDKGDFEIVCSGDILVTFTPTHRVLVRIPMEVPEGYTWAFQSPLNVYLEVDANGTFESRLQ